MSTLRAKSSIVAVLCSDLHLSVRPPPARAGERDWFEAMARPLRQISELSEEYHVPVLCAGDVFDSWKPPPVLINFALAHLPAGMVAIPGQHDLPYHSLDEIGQSAFWTLVRAGRIHPVGYAGCEGMALGSIYVKGFPFGVEVDEAPQKVEGILRVALIHKYLWIEGCSFPGAAEEDRLDRQSKSLCGYDVVVVGDNHRSFLTKLGRTVVFNCGAVMRRMVDEERYEPVVGLLQANGRVQLVDLDVAQDAFRADRKKVAVKHDLAGLIAELAAAGTEVPDFRQSVLRLLKATKVRKAVRRAVLEVLDEAARQSGETAE